MPFPAFARQLSAYMNVLIGLTIILVLMLGDSVEQNEMIGSDNLRLALLVLLTSIPPLFAAIQVFAFQRVFGVEAVGLEKKQTALRRYALAHSAVWFCASLATVALIQWQLTVRDTWQLDRFPLLDEFVILMPILVSLIASWFILFDTQRSEFKPIEIRRARAEYVSIRCKVYLLVVLVPVAAMILVKDYWFVLERLPIAVICLLMIGMLVTLLCLMPVLVGWMWCNRPIAGEEGRTRLLQLCNHHQMRVKDIRVWDTGNQIVNAMVAGVFPKFRVLMVSDLLLSSFPDHEVQAVLRHEAGHLRLRHLPVRIGFVLLPALAMIALELDPNQTVNWFSEMLVERTGLAISNSLVPGLAFIVYIVLVTAWLSKNMEFEADLYAAGALGFAGCKPAAGADSPAFSMADALLRFAQQNPDQYSRRSITHPSLFDRIELIRDSIKEPELGRRFSRQFSVRKALLAFSILATTVLLLLV